jgi:Nif-specific regulatory protein
LAKLAVYPWPGNVRELANTIERAVVLGNGPVLGMKDLPSRIVATAARPAMDGRSYRDAMENYRRELVLTALERSHGNRAAAARALGIHEKYLFKLLKSLGIAG